MVDYTVSMPTVDLQLPHHRYAIHIEAGLLAKLGRQVRAIAPHERAALIVDERIADTHGRVAADSLQHAGYQVQVLHMPPGEANKTLETVRTFYDALIDARLERQSPIIALGGGITGDTTGFVSATYLRGTPFIQCPTTLLAMVDASVGGKVGVNLPQGKNLIGAFHQPHLVAIDIDTLSTLPEREIRCGLAECVKHAVLGDAALFAWIRDHIEGIRRLDRATMIELVERNVRIKAAVVMEDEKESALDTSTGRQRAHLNFGHTFAHAIEAQQYEGEGARDEGRWARGEQNATSRGASSSASPLTLSYEHGEAVAMGMVAATRLACDTGRCDRRVLDQLIELLDAIGLPTRAASLGPTNRLLEIMRLDKKVQSGRIRLVLPRRLGEVVVVNDIDDAAIGAAWDTLRTTR